MGRKVSTQADLIFYSPGSRNSLVKMQSLPKYLAFLAFFLPALSLAATALGPLEFGLEPVVKSLVARQQNVDLENIDVSDIDLSGLLDLIGPILDFLNPKTFENLAIILRNAAGLLSDENTEILVDVVALLGGFLTPELVDMLKGLLGDVQVIFGGIGQVINALIRWLFTPSGDDGGDDGGDGGDGGDDGGDDGGSGGIEWPDLGGDDSDGGDGGSDSPDNTGGDDGGDDGGFDWDFGGGDDDSGDSGPGGDDGPSGDDSSGGDVGGDDDVSGNTGGEDGGETPGFEGAGVRADPVAAASFAIFAGALGVMMAL